MNFLYDEQASGSYNDTSNKVKDRSNREKHAETRFIPKFLPITEVRPVGEVWALPICKAQRHNRLTLISDESRHKDHPAQLQQTVLTLQEANAAKNLQARICFALITCNEKPN